MRAFVLLSLAACAGAPVEEAGLTFEADAPMPPPGVPLTLQISQLNAGAAATFQISNADPGESVYILRSTAGTGAGPCPGFMGGECVDLQLPISPMGPFTANGAGVASITATVPSGVPFATHACFQAVALRGPGGVDTVKSPTVCRVTNNGPVDLAGGANTGDTYDDLVSMGGPGLFYAMKHVATTTQVAGYVEVFTGEISGPNVLEIWSHDAVNDRPLAPVATTTWTSTVNAEWQGGPLGLRHLMPAGSTWWVVWQPINGAQSTRDASGAPVQYRGSFDGGVNWNGPFSQPEKYKLCGGGGCP